MASPPKPALPGVLAQRSFRRDSPVLDAEIATFAKTVTQQAGRYGLSQCLVLRKDEDEQIEIVVIPCNPTPGAPDAPHAIATSEAAITDAVTHGGKPRQTGPVDQPSLARGLTPGGVGASLRPKKT